MHGYTALMRVLKHFRLHLRLDLGQVVTPYAAARQLGSTRPESPWLLRVLGASDRSNRTS
jgi:hypothetical protein